MTKRLAPFGHESATCLLVINEDDNTAVLSHVYSIIRHAGHATGLMERVVAYADKYNLEVSLHAQAYGHPVQTILSNDALVKFYEQFGFVAEGFDVCHVRTPMTRTRR